MLKNYLEFYITAQAQFVRYARSITINVALQDFTTQGYIYPPALIIEYGTVSLADASAGAEVDVSKVEL